MDLKRGAQMAVDEVTDQPAHEGPIRTNQMK
jgi:hypothetical protein